MVCLNGIKKTTADKCHLSMRPFSNNKMTITNYNITSSNSEELIGEVIDSEATFAKHIENLCRKTTQKSHVLVRVANFLTLEKRRLAMKTFSPQFNYFPLVWCATVENLIANLIDYMNGL